MRTIAIIGAGQAGLQLAIHLLTQENYAVTLFTDRSPEQIRQGRIMSSQGMFATALQIEKKLGLNHWDHEAPVNTSVRFSLANNDFSGRAIHWKGMVKPFQSIDQRVKHPYWMEVFEQLGGKLVTEAVDIKALNRIAEQHELTLVATGKGEISQAFERDSRRSRFNRFQRTLACLYVNGMEPDSHAPGVHVNILPGLGEYFTIPGLTHTGRCEMMLFEAHPEGPFDSWDTLSSPEEQLEKAKSLLLTYVPWEAERCQRIRLTDNHATLYGRFTPTVRYPTLTLANNKTVLGLGDTVVLNDPIGGQGANHACKSAAFYAERIIQHGKKAFDKAWMQETGELSWNKYGKMATQLSEMMLTPPPHLLDVFQLAASQKTLANRLASGFDDPETLAWLFNPTDAKRVLRHENKNTHHTLSMSLAY